MNNFKIQCAENVSSFKILFSEDFTRVTAYKRGLEMTDVHVRCGFANENSRKVRRNIMEYEDS